jgi:acyl dehydratase
LVEQSRIDAFAEATEDRQWIHCDAARARAGTSQGATIAHGFLTLALLSRLLRLTVRIEGDFIRIVNYGLNRVRFPAPVLSGSRIRARFKPLAVESVEGGFHVCWLVTVEAEAAAKPSLVAEWWVRYAP